MAEPVGLSMKSWVVDRILWDKSGKPLQGFWGAPRALRKVLIALLVSAVMTWKEWVTRHPPEIALIAVLHFVFALVAVALLVYVWQFLRR
jgi:hypothetical protein